MNIKHCIECGARYKQQDDTTYKCPHGHTYFNNPRASADVWIFDQGKVMMTVRAREPGKGLLDPPGGFLDFNDTSEEAAIRELKEETGYDVSLDGIIGTHRHFYIENTSVIGIAYAGRITGGEEMADDDVASIEWISVDNPPKDRFAFGWIAEFWPQIQQWHQKDKK